MALFIDGFRTLVRYSYPTTTTPPEKAACALGTTFKVGLLIASGFEYAGYLAIPYIGWIHLGVGVASVGLHLAGGFYREKDKLGVELLEILPPMILGGLSGGHILSPSQMGLGTLISLSTTLGLRWIGAPTLYATGLPLRNWWKGDLKTRETENDALLRSLVVSTPTESTPLKPARPASKDATPP